MIEKVNNLTIKSFKNYTGPNDSTFKKNNIIFGYNGKGKSSLAKGIIDEFNNSSVSEDRYRLFNRDYIKESMAINEDKTKLKGIKVDFSKKNVDIDKEINEKEKKIIDLLPLDNKLNKMKNALQKEFDEIEKKKKGKKRIRFSEIDWLDPLKQYNEAYEKALIRVDNETQLDNVKNSEDIEHDIDLLNSFTIINEFNVENLQLDNINRINNTIYDSNDVPPKKIFDWLKEGNKIHKEINSKKCLYCGSDYDLDEIIKKTEQYEKDKKQADSSMLSYIFSIIKYDLQKINNFLDSIKLIGKILSEEIDDYIEIINKEINNINEVAYVINNKSEDINKAAQINTEVLKESYYKIDSALKQIEKIRFDKIQKLKKENDNINEILKGAIAKEILNSKIIESQIEEINELSTDINKKKIENEKIGKEINDLMEAKSDIGDFAIFVSEILAELEMQIKIVPNGDDYLIKHTDENITLSIDDISEGESNMLALLFFYYELFVDNKQEKIKDEIELIVIDDPISSIDDFNRIYIISLIKKLIELKKEDKQVFVLTHVWDDFCEFCYGIEKDENNNGIYEIYKTSYGSQIRTRKNHNEKPYRHCFKEIYELSQKNNYSDLTDCEVYHYPNVMRRILEEFLEFKATFHNVANSRLDAICEVFFGKDCSSKKRSEMLQIINLCNINSHENVRDPNEILKCAKNLMKFIESADKNHFNAMKN